MRAGPGVGGRQAVSVWEASGRGDELFTAIYYTVIYCTTIFYNGSGRRALRLSRGAQVKYKV